MKSLPSKNFPMAKSLITSLFIFIFMVGCTNIPITPDIRSPEEKKADLALSISELSGEYDVVESRNEVYPRHNFKVASTLTVTKVGESMVFKLVDKSQSELVIFAVECHGNNHKLSINLFCSKATSGMSYVSFGKERHEYQIKSGALISAFPPLDIRVGDFVLNFSESGSGKPHHYKLKKK
jgi:hypothetical protein